MTNDRTPSEPYLPHAALYVTGETLDPNAISNLLGIAPSRSFARGDIHPTAGRRSHGLWALNSARHVESPEPIAHLRWITSQLWAARLGIRKLLDDETLDIVLTVFWIMPSTHEILVLDPTLIGQVAELNLALELSVYSPEE